MVEGAPCGGGTRQVAALNAVVELGKVVGGVGGGGEPGDASRLPLNGGGGGWVDRRDVEGDATSRGAKRGDGEPGDASRLPLNGEARCRVVSGWEERGAYGGRYSGGGDSGGGGGWLTGCIDGRILFG